MTQFRADYSLTLAAVVRMRVRNDPFVRWFLVNELDQNETVVCTAPAGSKSSAQISWANFILVLTILSCPFIITL